MNEKILIRKEIIKTLSETYYSFLKNIEWNNELYLLGLREGKNKFLSNAYLHLCKGKYSISNYQSKEALSILNGDNGIQKSGNLVFEHMVPKDRYIQKPCEELAKSGELSPDFIYKLLEEYWFIATITKDEEKLLKTAKVMPKEWENTGHIARYENTKIELIQNPIWVNN
jgi:hypothetical protein